MGLRQVQFPWLTDVIATTDATPTISAAASYAVPANGSGYVEIDATIKSGTTLVASGVKRIPFVCNAGGTTVTLLTALISLALGGSAGLLTAVVDATSSGATVQPRVTGIVATNLSFQISCKYFVD